MKTACGSQIMSNYWCFQTFASSYLPSSVEFQGNGNDPYQSSVGKSSSDGCKLGYTLPATAMTRHLTRCMNHQTQQPTNCPSALPAVTLPDFALVAPTPFSTVNTQPAVITPVHQHIVIDAAKNSPLNTSTSKPSTGSENSVVMMKLQCQQSQHLNSIPPTMDHQQRIGYLLPVSTECQILPTAAVNNCAMLNQSYYSIMPPGDQQIRFHCEQQFLSAGHAVPIPLHESFLRPTLTPTFQTVDEAARMTSITGSEFNNQHINFSDLRGFWEKEFYENFRKFHPHRWCLETANGMDIKMLLATCYHQADSAKVRFICQDCGNAWTSMKGRVSFFITELHNDINDGILGTVYFKLLGQICQKCKPKDFQSPLWYPEEIVKVVRNISHYVGKVRYGLPVPVIETIRRPGKPRTQHQKELCQACAEGLCREATSSTNPRTPDRISSCDNVDTENTNTV